MKILVACEESQAVTIELRRLGHEAYSCDIQECSGGHPEWHIQGDVLPLIYEGGWDMIIAHPPCTYLTNAGARWLYADGKLNEERYQKGLQAKAFFMEFFNADCTRIAIENPVPSAIFDMPKPTQTIQPYEYGHPYSKKTYLWLKGLPPLVPTQIVNEHIPFVSSGTYSKTHDPRYKGASRSGGAAKMRSKTFPGIARAMAEQWAGRADNDSSD
jgi:hypothetical protein